MPLSDEDLLEFAKTYANVLNIKYFDGNLKCEFAIHTREVKRWYMQINPDVRPVLIYINPIMCFASNYELEEVITHELIHFAQLALGLKADHGPTFRQLSRKFGIPIEASMSCVSARVRTLRQMKIGGPLLHQT